MASAMRKMAVYLGLVEDDHRYQDKYDSYGEYEDYDESGLAEGPDEPDARAGRESWGAGETGWGLSGPRVASRAADRSRSYHDTASAHLQ